MSIGRVPGATGIQPSIVTAKGDLIVATASGSVTNQAVGSNNQVLTADSAQADGVKWANGSAATLTTTGDLLYASAANTPARLAIGSTDQVLKVSGGIPAWGAAPAASYVGASAYRTSALSCNNGADVTVTFDAEYFDTDGIHSTTTNTERFTVPTGKGGKWLVTYAFTFAAASAGIRWSYIYKNTVDVYTTQNLPTTASNTVTISGSVVLNLVAGDYIYLKVGQNSGGALNLNSDYPTSLQFTYLGA